MYEVFYGLKEKPFSLLPDPSYLYLSDKHQMALTLLEYSLVNQAGFCVISGVTGAGKTTLIRHLLNQFGDNVAVGLITNTHQSFSELLRWILMAFNLDYSSDSKPLLYHTFVNFLIEQYAKNRNTVLIVDEAQNMSIETLEELRMLSNINADKDQVLQIILVGQPGLRDKLSRPDLEQFAQRIAVDYHIEPLNADETRNYIRHRLTIAGGDPELFEKDAALTVYNYSNGIPRLINLLCESAMVYGYAEGLARISARLVDEVARERRSHGLLPHLQVEPAHAADQASNTTGETGEVKKAPHPPAPEPTPVTLPLQSVPVEAEALVETVRNAERAVSAAGGSSGAGKSETRQSAEIQAQEYRSDAAEAAMPVGVTQADTTRERRPGVISKLVRLDAWPRSATDAGHGNRHVTRTEVKPQVSGVVAGRLQNPAPTQIVADRNEGAELPQEVGVSSPDQAPDMSVEVTGDSEAGAQFAAVHEDRDMTESNNNTGNRRAGMGTGGKWIVAASLGFSGGLLVAVVVFVMTYFKAAIDMPAVPPLVADLASSATTDAGPSISVPPSSTENVAPADHALFEALQRERDAALAQTRALERERDAALAAAKVRELTNAAELGAAKARAREKAATLEAIKAQERARTAELEAMFARERERAAALAATSAQVSKPQVEPKPAAPAEPVVAAPATKAADTEAQAEAKAVAATASVSASADKPAATEAPAKFSANPCKGPSAKFLSTCKE
jgi:type II secretory pathway predicted ATPase ExeA